MDTIELDGHTLVVECLDATGPSGRSAFMTPLAAHNPGDGAYRTTPGFELEKVGMWPGSSRTQLEGWLERAPTGDFWFEADRPLRLRNREFDIGVDPGVLRSPVPIDLLLNDPRVESVRASDGYPPYEGPPVLWRWVRHLTSQIAADRYRFGTTHTYLSRESFADVCGENEKSTGLFYVHNPSFGSQNPVIGVSNDVIDCHTSIPTEQDRHGQPLLGAPVLSYVLPMRSIAALGFDLRFVETRPLIGKAEKALFDTRGFGCLNKVLLDIWFSDGWRLSELHVRIEDLSIDQEQPTLALLNWLVQTIATRRLATAADSLSTADSDHLQRTIAAGMGAPAPTQKADSATQGKADKVLFGNPFTAELDVTFPGAVHYGIPAGHPLLHHTR